MSLLTVLLSTLIGFLVGRWMIQTSHSLSRDLLACCGEENIPCPKIKSIVPEVGVSLFFGAIIFLFPFDIPLLFVLTISCLLIGCFVTDYEYGILPDQFTYSLLWVGLIASLFPIFVTPQEAIIGAAAGYGVFWLINFIYRFFRGFDGMYPGDFKLNAAIGACIGFKWLLPVVIVSMLLLVIFTAIKRLSSQKSPKTNLLYQEIPYGCYASLVTVAFLLYFTN